MKLWDFENLKLEILKLEILKIWNLELSVWNLQFEIWKFGIFGIWKFGIRSLMLGDCNWVVVCSCWNLGHCMVDYVVILALEHFCNVVSFGHGVIWPMLVAYGILATLVICNVVGWVLAWILGALKSWNFGNVGNLWCLLDVLRHMCFTC